MSLRSLEREAIRTLDRYLASGYTIDLGGLIGMVAAQFTPSEPSALAQLAITEPSLLTREPDVRLVTDDSLTAYALLRANTYEHIAGKLREECVQRRSEELSTA